MASEVIAFPVNLRRNQNKYNAAYGKYYAEADSKEPLNLKGFAKHISEYAESAYFSAGGIRWTSHCGKAMVMPAAVRAS